MFSLFCQETPSIAYKFSNSIKTSMQNTRALSFYIKRRNKKNGNDQCGYTNEIQIELQRGNTVYLIQRIPE